MLRLVLKRPKPLHGFQSRVFKGNSRGEGCRSVQAWSSAWLAMKQQNEVSRVSIISLLVPTIWGLHAWGQQFTSGVGLVSVTTYGSCCAVCQAFIYVFQKEMGVFVTLLCGWFITLNCYQFLRSIAIFRF